MSLFRYSAGNVLYLGFPLNIRVSLVDKKPFDIVKTLGQVR